MIPILGVPIFSGPFDESVTAVIQGCHQGVLSNSLISATGAHGIVYSQKVSEFKSLLGTFTLNLPDGMPVVWVGRLKGAKGMERCYGPRFFEMVIRSSARHSIRHFLCGGKAGVAQELQSVCRKAFYNNNIVDCYTPPFREMSDEEMADLGKRITAVSAEIVWIGLSTPKQELFASRLAKFVNVKYLITVGAAFDFHTGRLRQAPSWIQTAGFEWLFRLLMEPKRLFGRYIEVVPLFLYYAFVDVMNFWLKKKEFS